MSRFRPRWLACASVLVFASAVGLAAPATFVATPSASTASSPATITSAAQASAAMADLAKGLPGAVKVSEDLLQGRRDPNGPSCSTMPAFKSTEDAHRSVMSSPFFQARLEYVEDAIPQMEGAIRSRNFEQIGKLAELDTLLLHGITMTGVDELFLWRPETVSIILEVKKMRKEGLECYFSIDTGATVYVNSRLEDTGEVAKRIEALGINVLKCHVGDEAKVVGDHLF